jgi:hypothetical protein
MEHLDAHPSAVPLDRLAVHAMVHSRLYCSHACRWEGFLRNGWIEGLCIRSAAHSVRGPLLIVFAQAAAERGQVQRVLGRFLL